MNDGLTEEEARLKVNQKLNGVELDQFMSRYGTLIQYILQLKNGKLHSKVMKVVDDLLEDGIDYKKKAVKVAIRKYKHMLENYLDEVIDNENSDEGDDASDDDDDADEDEDEDE